MSSSNITILAYEATPLGLLCLRRRRLLSDPDTVVTEMTLNHEFLMSSLHTESERGLARHGLEFHNGQDLRVLIGGLGLGYTAREVLRSSRVARVEVVEVLPQVIDWVRQGLIPTAPQLNSDDRCTITAGDIFARLASEPGELFDLILIDIDHSPQELLSDSHCSFYSRVGVTAAKAHLALGGCLGVWSYADHPPFEDALRRTFRTTRVAPITFVNRLIQEEETNWLYFATDAAVEMPRPGAQLREGL